MSRPALGVAGALAVGIWAAEIGLPLSGILAGAGSASAAALVYVRQSRDRLVTLRPLVLTGAALLGVVALGTLRMTTWSIPSANSLDRLLATHSEETPLTLWGRVTDAPTQAAPVRFTVRIDSVQDAFLLAAADSSSPAHPVTGRVRVTFGTSPFAETLPLYPVVRQGDQLRLRGEVRPFDLPRNPADVDYDAFLARQGVSGTLWLSDANAVAVLGPARNWLDRCAATFHLRITRALARAVPSEAGRSALSALLIADRSLLDPAVREAFAGTGLMHLLAVSGLHLMLVGLVLYTLLKPLLGRLGWSHQTVETTRALVTLLLLAVYVIIAGAGTAVVRAFVMTALVLVGRAWQRRSDPLNALGVAALLLLLIRPPALFDVGFQLSFSAVAALVTLTPLLTGPLPTALARRPLPRWIAQTAAASLAATLGTAPVLLAHFGRVPLAGLLLNTIAIPLTAGTLGVGLLAVLSPHPELSASFGTLADLFARGLLGVSEAGAAWMGSLAVTSGPTPSLVLIALVLAWAALALWKRPRLRMRLGLAALGCLVLSAGINALPQRAVPDMEVFFLDVGQGDAALLRLPGGRHMLIDAGPRTPFSDAGERTVLRHLDRYRITHLDALVVTHADADHAGGAPSVLRGVSVGRLFHNGIVPEDGPAREMITLADSLGVPTRSLVAGDTLGLSRAVRVRVLSPTPSVAAGRDDNEASVVLHVEFGMTRWLFLGDAEHRAEKHLVQRWDSLLTADVVKVGHHGSRTSSSEALVKEVSLRDETQAVVSVAARNRYGLPHPEPLTRWRRAGARLHLTAEEGAVWFSTDGSSIERNAWRRPAWGTRLRHRVLTR